MPRAVRYEQLAEASTSLDTLCREASGDIRSQRRFDELEEEAHRIGSVIVSAFRGPGENRRGQ